MKEMITKRLNKLYLQWLGTVDQGKQLELIAADREGKELDEYQYPLATIRADESTEDLLFEIYIDDSVVQIPVAEIRRALDLAEGEVRSEKWYEENIYPKE